MRDEIVERGGHLIDPGIGEGDGALGGGVDVLLALPLDQPVQPEIEGKHRRTGKQRADGNRDQIPARNRAQANSHPGPWKTTCSGAATRKPRTP